MNGTDVLLLIVAVVAAAGLGVRWGLWRGRRGAAYRAASRQRELRRELRGSRDLLERASAELQATWSTVPTGLLIVDDVLTIRAANPRARTWFDLGDEVAGTSLMVAIRSAELREVIDDSRRGNGEMQPVRLGDRLFGVRVAQLPQERMLVSLEDQTLLERLERARRDLVANVSHDLRTPLTSLRLLLESLDQRLGHADPSSQVVHQLTTQVETIVSMAEGLVELNRLESGRSLFRLAPEPLIAMVEEAGDGLSALLADASMELRHQVPQDLWVLADRRHVVRTLSNLLDNARHHAPEGSTIEVGARSDGRDVLIWTTDQGPGIAPRDRERIFERFYRADRSRGSEGSGLGLAIAKHIVVGHGGRIWAEATTGRGATLCFTLLAADDPSPAAAGDLER